MLLFIPGESRDSLALWEGKYRACAENSINPQNRRASNGRRSFNHAIFWKKCPPESIRWLATRVIAASPSASPPKSFTLPRTGGGQAKALACRPDGGGILDLGLYLHKMRQGLLLCSVLLRLAADSSHGSQADEDREQHGEPNRAISGDYADDRGHHEQPGDDTGHS